MRLKNLSRQRIPSTEAHMSHGINVSLKDRSQKSRFGDRIEKWKSLTKEKDMLLGDIIKWMLVMIKKESSDVKERERERERLLSSVVEIRRCVTGSKVLEIVKGTEAQTNCRIHLWYSSICPPIQLFIYPSIHPHPCPPIYQSIYLYILYGSPASYRDLFSKRVRTTSTPKVSTSSEADRHVWTKPFDHL